MKRSHTQTYIRYGGGIAIVVLMLYGTYATYRLNQTQSINRGQTETIDLLRTTIAELEGNLSLSAYERDRLTFVLDETQQEASSLISQTKILEGRVSELEELRSIDPELLKKYSKVYFLNEHYTPSGLTAIDQTYVSQPSRVLQFHTDALPHLQALLEDSASAGANIRVASAYRSFKDQQALKTRNAILYGSGANRFSADQGYSEHQLGTTVDLTTATTGTLTNAFDKTPEYQWLIDNAHRYGFTLSYPKGNAYYIYEPWHWRFVGITLATELHQAGRHLYDLDQRTIDRYLLHLFD